MTHTKDWQSLTQKLKYKNSGNGNEITDKLLMLLLMASLKSLDKETFESMNLKWETIFDLNTYLNIWNKKSLDLQIFQISQGILKVKMNKFENF